MNTKMIQIKPVETKGEWESFLLAQDLPPFLQSWNAAEQNKQLGHECLMLGLYRDATLIGVCLVERIHARRGRYLSIPYGPVLSEPANEEALTSLVDYLTQWGRTNRYHFIRLAPYWEKSDSRMSQLAHLGFRVSPIHMLSELVWKLDLSPSEEDLLMGMRKNTRNLIRRAQKDGVSVKSSTSEADLKAFFSLMQETHKRHDFVAYPDSLYREQLRQFKDDDEVLIFNSFHDDHVLASAMIMYYGNAASYHHGASVPTKIPVTYLLQWEAIREAKRRGCKEYSFWGIVDTENKKHPFYGITTFKKGFGGSPRYLVPCHDKPLSAHYYLTYLIEVARRIKRGFGFSRE